MELFHASRQWATRPADERFATLADLYAATKRYAEASKVREALWSDLRVEATVDDELFVTRGATPAKLTNYAFGQMAARVGAPVGYLRELPATLAAQNLNHGLKSRVEGTAQLLFHQNDGLLLRAATSDEYSRIWNYEVVDRLMRMADRFSLIPAQQTFTWSGEAPPDDPADKALYASDHDMFAFLMSKDRPVLDPTGNTLRRGIITVNSEVGDCSLKVLGFYFREICGNHIIWGAEQIAEIRLTHRGKIHERWLDSEIEIRKYLDTAESFDQAKFQALTVHIADDKDAVLDKLFGLRAAIGLSRKVLTASYDAVDVEQDGDPRSVWGFAQGVTRYSQTIPFADQRMELDRAAGKLLDLAASF